MPYATGINPAVNSGPNLRTQVETLMAQVGWTQVDDDTNGIYNTHVWKNPAANNRSGQDFYLMLATATTQDTYLAMSYCEAYDPATHLASKPAVYQATSPTLTLNADSTAGTTGVRPNPSTTVNTAAAVAAQWQSLTVNTQKTWVAYATANMVAVVGSPDSGNALYMGAFSPLMVPKHANENGLIMWYATSSLTPTIFWSQSRVPGFSGSVSGNVYSFCSYYTYGLPVSTRDIAYGSFARPTQMCVVRYDVSGQTDANVLRMKLDEFAWVPFPGTNYAHGDTATINIDGVATSYRYIHGIFWVKDI